MIYLHTGLLNLKGVRDQIQATATGTKVRHTAPSRIYDVRSCLPPIGEQRAIAHILGTLDDNIELNRQMNQTLEEIAAALFRSWFIDFDPVRAKMAGRTPEGMDAATVALFPERLVESEVGEIPEGWACGKLSDICSTQYGYTASASEETIGPKFLRVKDINKLDWIEWNTVPYCSISDSDYTKYRLDINDILVARMADPGKSAMIDEAVDAVFASYLVRLRTSSPEMAHFVFRYLKSDSYKSYAEQVKSGSVQSNMNARVITGVSLVLPPDAILRAFHAIFAPLRQRIAANVAQSMTLSTLRDILLPRLLSGELRVPAGEVSVPA